jgi:hypothetical protein
MEQVYYLEPDSLTADQRIPRFIIVLVRTNHLEPAETQSHPAQIINITALDNISSVHRGRNISVKRYETCGPHTCYSLRISYKLCENKLFCF